MAEDITYIVDTENVSAGSFVGVDALPKSAKVYYFFSSRSYRPTYPEVQKLLNCKCKIEFVESAKSGINALDFQITTFLGYLIGKSQTKGKHKYVLISNDTGFDATVLYWQREGELVSRQETMGDYDPIVDEETNEIIENKDQQLENAFNQLSSINRKKLNYNKVVSLAPLHLKKDRYALILSSIYKSENVDEFIDKIRIIPNSQINAKKKEDIYALVNKNFKEFKRKNYH